MTIYFFPRSPFSPPFETFPVFSGTPSAFSSHRASLPSSIGNPVNEVFLNKRIALILRFFYSLSFPVLLYVPRRIHSLSMVTQWIFFLVFLMRE